MMELKEELVKELTKKAKVVIKDWRVAYNDVRPHSGPNYQPPMNLKNVGYLFNNKNWLAIISFGSKKPGRSG